MFPFTFSVVADFFNPFSTSPTFSSAPFGQLFEPEPEPCRTSWAPLLASAVLGIASPLYPSSVFRAVKPLAHEREDVEVDSAQPRAKKPRLDGSTSASDSGTGTGRRERVTAHARLSSFHVGPRPAPDAQSLTVIDGKGLTALRDPHCLHVNDLGQRARHYPYIAPHFLFIYIGKPTSWRHVMIEPTKDKKVSISMQDNNGVWTVFAACFDDVLEKLLPVIHIVPLLIIDDALTDAQYDALEATVPLAALHVRIRVSGTLDPALYKRRRRLFQFEHILDFTLEPRKTNGKSLRPIDCTALLELFGFVFHWGRYVPRLFVLEKLRIKDLESFRSRAHNVDVADSYTDKARTDE